jgi:type IV secretory pathway TrbL component
LRLALANVYALIASASVLLAFAPLPWTWSMFPGWGLSVLSACIKVFFLLAVLALGLTEASGWTAAMGATSRTIAEDTSLAMQAMVESVLFLGLVYYIPNLLAGLVIGGAGAAMNAGEAIIGGIVGSAASSAGSTVAAAAKPGAIPSAATSAAQTISKMLLR